VSRLKQGVVAVLIVLPGLAVPAAGLFAQRAPERRSASVECCLQLRAPVGARATGLGNTLVARGGADGVWVNPAALTGLERDELRIHSVQDEIETSTAFSLSFRVPAAGIFGLNYRLTDYGESAAMDPYGNPVGTLRVLEHYLVASYATGMGPGVSGGISYKLFQFRHDCIGHCLTPSVAATTHAIDFGVQYHPPVWPSLRLGASVTHLGPPLQALNAEQADPLPTRVRVGAAYELMQHFAGDTTVALWASANVRGSWREGVEQLVGLGLELSMDRTIFIRTGYATGRDHEAGAAIGVGLRHDRFDVGIARTFLGAAGRQDPFQITFAVGF
jgi:hypothetical protein